MKLRVGERIGAWRRDRLAGSLLVLLSLGLWWVNRTYPMGTIHEPGPGFMPLVLAVILAIAGVAVMKFGGDERLRDTPWTEVPRVFTILAACGVAMLIFQHAGYRLTVATLPVTTARVATLPVTTARLRSRTPSRNTRSAPTVRR